MIAPLRVLHVLDSLRPGGTENGVVNVAQQLAGKVDTHVACLRSSGDFADKLPSPQQVYVLGKGSSFTLGAVTALNREIRRVQPDVVHTHNLGPLIYASMATAAGTVVPIVHGEHGQIQERERNARRRWQRRLLYHCCAGLHTVSHSMLQSLNTDGIPVNRMTAIPNGVDARRFCPGGSKLSSRTTIGMPPNALVLGIVGRFVALKRHRLLLDAFTQLALKIPATRLLIVGAGGDDEAAVTALIENHPLRHSIDWVGMQSNMVPYYQAMDLLVAPSMIEGLSNAVLEAMACGVPVLAHQACGNSEVIEHEQNGFCDDLSDLDDLVRALLQRLADRAALANTGRAARQHVVDNFSLESMACGYHTLYTRCARRLPQVLA